MFGKKGTSGSQTPPPKPAAPVKTDTAAVKAAPPPPKKAEPAKPMPPEQAAMLASLSGETPSKPAGEAPGFPKDGWVVRAEGLNRMP